MKFGAAENRTIGTSNGYADIATAEKKGAAISRSDLVSSRISNGGGSSAASSNQSYHHTTSIYEDNEKTTLLRVEYYDENNKLSQYSDVEYTDKNTNSYKENIYHWDEENGVEVLDRTDTYVNGTLSSSENHG